MSRSQSLDLPQIGRIDTLAQELALLQDKGKRRIAVLGSRHVPVVTIHLVELIARSLAQEGHSLVTSGSQGVNAAVIRAVLAVDPSSPFTGGAVLGDRIRMQEHALDDGVFIRSIGSRGDLGGLSSATSAIIKLFDSFGMDIVLIETVGVGQTELDIIKISDCVLVTLVPEAGDGVQAMKAGLMEIGDIFIVNKADRGGAEKLAREIDYMISLKHKNTNWNTKVILAEAENDVGTKNIVDEIDSFKEYEIQSNELNKKRTLRKVSEIETLLFQRMKYELESLKQDKDVKNIMSKVSKSDLEPEEAVNLIFKLFKKNF